MPSLNVQLRDAITKYFDLDEVRDLCFELDVTYDDLAGDTLSEKARELVLYFDRRQDVTALLGACKRKRPRAAWPAVPAGPSDTRQSPPAEAGGPAAPKHSAESARHIAAPKPVENPPAAAAGTAYLELTRVANAWAYSARRFGVFVDDAKSADVANGATVRMALRPGRHRIEVRIDLIKSGPLVVDLAAGQTTRIRVTYAMDSLLGSLRLEADG